MSRPRQYADTIETDRIRARDRKRTERARHRNTAVGVTETLPEPYYQDDWVTLYHGDCTALLPLLLPASVDLVLTDPPYETESHTNQRRVRGVGNGVQVKPIAFVPISDALRAVAARELARIARRWVL